MDNLDKKVGMKLKKIRESLGLTVREVGEKIGVHFTYIGKIENGKLPSLEKLNKLCELYGITMQSLFGNEIEIPKVLKEKGVEWITFIEEMENKNLSPEEILNILKVIDSLKK